MSIAYRDAHVGDVVIDAQRTHWEVIEIVQYAHLRVVDIADTSPHRVIYAMNWPSYREFTLRHIMCEGNA